MLIAHPHVIGSKERRTLATVTRKFRAWVPGLVLSCAAFHILAGLILGFAPEAVIVSKGTQPVLELLPREVWAVIFIGVGVLVYCLFSRIHRLSSIAIRTVVLWVAGAWFTTFLLAVFRGEGNAIGLIIWPFLYGPWLLAMRSLGKR